MMVWGWVISHLKAQGWHHLEAYRFLFYAYAAIGLVQFLLTCCLTKKTEIHTKPQSTPEAESDPLLAVSNKNSKPRWTLKSILPQISKESRSILIKLCLLFAIDAFASGLTPLYASLIV
jgi:hypothetical protein